MWAIEEELLSSLRLHGYSAGTNRSQVGLFAVFVAVIILINTATVGTDNSLSVTSWREAHPFLASHWSEHYRPTLLLLVMEAQPSTGIRAATCCPVVRIDQRTFILLVLSKSQPLNPHLEIMEGQPSPPFGVWYGQQPSSFTGGIAEGGIQ